MTKKEKILFGKLNLMRNDSLYGKPKIKIGFVGGGPNSFIGYSHRLAARFDNRFDFVAGVFSRDIKKSIKFGKSLGLDPSRCYDDYISMSKIESKRTDGIEALGINKHFIESLSNIILNKEENKFKNNLYPPKERCPTNLTKCPCLN